MINYLTRLTDWILKGGSITFNEAVHLCEINEQRDIVSLISFANVIREKFSGNKLNFYVNINLKTGECGNDCDICFNHPHFDIDIKESAKAKKNFINGKAEEAIKLGADRISITVCGSNADANTDMDTFRNSIKKVCPVEIVPRVSLGMLAGENSAEYSRFCFNNDSGNIDSPGCFDGDIERAAFFNERHKHLESARKRGYMVSSGLLSVAGGTSSQRLIPACVLKELDVDSIALNFFSSRKTDKVFNPMEALKILSIYRFMNPQKEIILGGSRWKNFGIIKPLILLSGANGVMAGNFFAAASRNVLEDVKSLADFKLIQ
jgi:biotin synthase